MITIVWEISLPAVKRCVVSPLYQRMQAQVMVEAPVHFVVATPALSWRQRDHEYLMSRLGASVVLTTFHRTKRLLGVAFVIEIAVCPDDIERLSFVTRGLGPLEIHLTAPRDSDALGLLYGVAHWLLADPDRPLQDGDTIWRSADERVPITCTDDAIHLALLDR